MKCHKQEWGENAYCGPDGNGNCIEPAIMYDDSSLYCSHADYDDKVKISNFWWAVTRVIWKLGVMKPYYCFNQWILDRLAGLPQSSTPSKTGEKDE